MRILAVVPFIGVFFVVWAVTGPAQSLQAVVSVLTNH